jgi:hypothetical protein
MPTIYESVAMIEELSGSGDLRAGLNAKALSTLMNLVKVLRFLYSEDQCFAGEFRVVIQKASRHTKGRSFWTHTLGISIPYSFISFFYLFHAFNFILFFV